MPRQGNCRVCGDAVVMRDEGGVSIPKGSDPDSEVINPNPKKQQLKLENWYLKDLNNYIANIIKEFLKENIQYEYLLTPNPIAEEFVDHLMKDVLKVEDEDALTCYDMMAGTGMESENFVKYKKNVTLYLGDLDPIVHTFLFERFLSVQDIAILKDLKDELGEYMKRQKINIKQITNGSELSILDIFDYKNKKNVKQAHIIHMDPHWPGGPNFKQAEFYNETYTIKGLGKEEVDITLFVVHLFDTIRDLKVVTVKVANFIVSDKKAMENNHLSPSIEPSIEGQKESTEGYIKNRSNIKWTLFTPKVLNYNRRGHIRYLIFQRAQQPSVTVP